MPPPLPRPPHSAPPPADRDGSEWATAGYLQWEEPGLYLNGEPERLGWRQRGGRNRNLRIYSRLSVFIFHFRRDFGNNLTQQVSSLAKRSSSGGALPGNPSLKQSDFLTGVKCDIPGWENTDGNIPPPMESPRSHGTAGLMKT